MKHWSNENEFSLQIQFFWHFVLCIIWAYCWVLNQWSGQSEENSANSSSYRRALHVSADFTNIKFKYLSRFYVSHMDMFSIRCNNASIDMNGKVYKNRTRYGLSSFIVISWWQSPFYWKCCKHSLRELEKLHWRKLVQRVN